MKQKQKKEGNVTSALRRYVDVFAALNCVHTGPKHAISVITNETCFVMKKPRLFQS